MMSGKTLNLSLLCCCVCSVARSSRGLSGSLEEEKMEVRERSDRAELCCDQDYDYNDFVEIGNDEKW